MAHKEKYTKMATGHMFAHYNRSKEVPNLLMPLNSVLNYNLAENDQPKSQLDFLHQRLGEVRVHNRKDVNVMVDWIVTAPKDLLMTDEDKFFRETYNFLNDRYGKENVISAYVHMDETTPHMHYAFVPIVEDKKRGSYKLSAKEAVTRRDLQTFHNDLSRHLEKAFGRDVGILNEATKDGNKTIEELKRGTAVQELLDARTEASKIVSNAKKAHKHTKDCLIPIQAEYEAKKAYTDHIMEESDKYPSWAVRSTKGVFKNKQEYVTVPIEEWEKRCYLIQERDSLRKAGKILDDRLMEFQKTTTASKMQYLVDLVKKYGEDKKEFLKENNRLKNRVKELEGENEKLLDRINKTLGKIPKGAAELFRSAWEETAKVVKRDWGAR